MERDSYLPKVGSFSNYVFNYDHNLYVVGWNNNNKRIFISMMSINAIAKKLF